MSEHGLSESSMHPTADAAFRFGPRHPDRAAWAAVAGDHHGAWPPPAPGSDAVPLDAYQPGLASELAGSMGRFSRMLHSWLRPHFLDADFLARAQQRYIRFLQLHGQLPPGQVLVPTADIALVWHTHLGLSSEYVSACEALFGRDTEPWRPEYLNLSDPAQLVAAYGETAKLYQQKYGEPYDGPDTAWLPDTVPYPLATAANPLAFALRVYDENPQHAQQQGAVAIACKAAELPPPPPPGAAVPRSGAHALFAAWLAGWRAEGAFQRASNGWRRLTGKGAALNSGLEHALVSLASLSYFLELPDTDTHPYIRAIELCTGLWGGPTASSNTARPAAPPGAGSAFSPTDSATYLSPAEAPVLEGLAAILSATAAAPPPSAGPKATKATKSGSGQPAAVWAALAERELAAAAPPLLAAMLAAAASSRGVGKMQASYIKEEICTAGCTICGSSDYYKAEELQMSGVQGPVRAAAVQRANLMQQAAAGAAAATNKTATTSTTAEREYTANGVLYRAPAEGGDCDSGVSASSSAPRRGRQKYWSRYASPYVPPIAFWGGGDGGGEGCGGGGGCGGS